MAPWHVGLASASRPFGAHGAPSQACSLGSALRPVQVTLVCWVPLAARPAEPFGRSVEFFGPAARRATSDAGPAVLPDPAAALPHRKPDLRASAVRRCHSVLPPHRRRPALGHNKRLRSRAARHSLAPPVHGRAKLPPPFRSGCASHGVAR